MPSQAGDPSDRAEWPPAISLQVEPQLDQGGKEGPRPPPVPPSREMERTALLSDTWGLNPMDQLHGLRQVTAAL